ncbi:nicotinate-nucleotide--dimethylbenzimidazole phosphoribosyltransferase [Maricurvus nonylphenolicus]|uniref:nicotinate-nucleotide--dimethylbenzimidazole phosphoribosyltransferase n=1 Tax=Maricurvus nonylphenolicus TaxID=1008307 RepID=UPI0036F33415
MTTLAQLKLDWLTQPAKPVCDTSQSQAEAHQQQLTKPPGSLGQLEAIAIQLAGLQGQEKPQIEQVHITVFAADHGIANAGVSAFPQAVTGEMIRNFAHGGAAIAVLAKQLGAQLQVVNLGTASELEAIAGVEANVIGPGTANFAEQAAMTETQLAQALNYGKNCIDQLDPKTIQLFIGGEMGIANTTTASALAAALLQCPAEAVVGPGTGINQTTQQHKQQVISQALQLHKLNQGANPSDPTYLLTMLRSIGGFEIAALTGAYLRAAQQGIAILVDGFIASVAALIALRLQPDLKPWLILGHRSAEPGHSKVVEALGLIPILDLNMRLGEGSGAACAVPLLKLACELHNNMATFDSANVSKG